MKKSCLFGFVCTCVFVIFITTLAHTASRPVEQCPVGTLIEPYSGICALVNDLKIFYSPDLTNRAAEVPNLKKLRQQNMLKTEQPSLAKEIQSVPPPGGIGAGTLYRQGSLQALTHSECLER